MALFGPRHTERRRLHEHWLLPPREVFHHRLPAVALTIAAVAIAAVAAAAIAVATVVAAATVVARVAAARRCRYAAPRLAARRLHTVTAVRRQTDRLHVVVTPAAVILDC